MSGPAPLRSRLSLLSEKIVGSDLATCPTLSSVEAVVDLGNLVLHDRGAQLDEQVQRELQQLQRLIVNRDDFQDVKIIGETDKAS